MLRHQGTITLETERLILRRFKETDVKNMFKNYASDEEVAKYLSWSAHQSEELTKQVIDRWIEEYQSEETYQWAIELKEQAENIGSISILDVNTADGNGKIGYCIGKSWWGQGIVTEALTAVLELAFTEIGFERIEARHDVENPASGRVMEKCGLTYEGTLRKIVRNNQGQLIDCKYYSILKEEYTSKHNS